LFGRRDLERRLAVLEKMLHDTDRQSLARDTRIEDRVSNLELDAVCPTRPLPVYGESPIATALRLAGTRGASLLVPGTRVRYMGPHTEFHGYIGTVVVRPRRESPWFSTDREPVIFVVWDLGSGNIRRHRAMNLARL
jgi:hypothetical protein